MSPIVVRKLKLVGLFCAFTSFVGVCYQLIDEQQVTLDSVLVGVPMGLVFGVLELFLLEGLGRRLQRRPFLVAIAIKALLYTSIVFVTKSLIGLWSGLVAGKRMAEFWTSRMDLSEWTIIGVVLAVYTVLLFFLQMNRRNKQ